MSGNTSIVDSTPFAVANADGFGAQDVRLGTMMNPMPGLFESGDFAVSQRAAGANMSVDIAAGRAIIDPQGATHQGAYVAHNQSTYNTDSDGGYSWTAADGSNPRIDLVCVRMQDNAIDSSGDTGWRFAIVDGTPNAGATHQLVKTYWPAIPTGYLPIAAIRVPAGATTITTANITNLNPVGGGRSVASYIATAETTTSTSYTRLATPHFGMVYVPAAGMRLTFAYKAQWKISSASGTQGVALFINDTQLKAPVNEGAPVSVAREATLGTFYSHLATFPNSASHAAATTASFSTVAGATGDVSDVSTGQILGIGVTSANTITVGQLEIFGLAAGWHLLEVRFKTSANTLSVRERYLWAEVCR